MNKIIHKLIIIFLLVLLQASCAPIITPNLDKIFRVEQTRLGELRDLRL